VLCEMLNRFALRKRFYSFVEVGAEPQQQD
jgi:hypothetical protein